MIGDKRFFQEFFDGQIVKPETKAFKLFKILLVSIVSVAGLLLFMLKVCGWPELLLLITGLIWNVFTSLDKKLSIPLSIVVALLHFFIAAKFKLYAIAFIYIAVYLPLQLIATSKDYSEGNFVQIKKKIADINMIVFYLIVIAMFEVLALIDTNIGANLVVFDSLSATLLVCSAILRNERYSEYYAMRIFAIIASILLWVLVLMNYSVGTAVVLIMLYASYLVYDLVNCIVQHKTYLNQYMLQVKKHDQIENKPLIQKKLVAYKKSKPAKID